MSHGRNGSIYNGRQKSTSVSYPLSNGGPRYQEVHDLDSPPTPTRPDHRQRSSAMPKYAIITVIAVALFLLIPGSQIYKRHWTPYGMFGDDLDKNPTKHLIIASYTAQNVSWLDQIPSDWTPKRYFLDDPNPPNGLSVPRNQGREAMAYLTYIIDHYDDLPSYMVFTHGHYRSWHQVEPLPQKIRALNLTALAREHYISLRCGDQMGCERVPYVDTLHVNWPGEEGMREFWKMLVPYEDLPQYISYKCCAQHAVTRTAVRRRSKEDWIRIRAPLIGELDTLTMIPNVAFTPQWVVGAWFEKIWHVLFGVGGEYCPSVEYCNQVHFSNAIACDQGTDFHMDDGNAWEDTVCVSAFDGLHPDEPANLTNFDIIDIGARLHRERRDRLNKIKDEEKARVQSLEKVAAEATATAKPKRPAADDKAKFAAAGAGVDTDRWSDDAEAPTRQQGKSRPAADFEKLEEEAEGHGWSGSGGTRYEEAAGAKGRLPPRHV